MYTLGNKSSVPDARIEEMVRAVAESAPSSYNSQSQRYVLLLGERSKNFWEQVTDIVKPLIIGAMGEEGWNFFSGRMAVFRGAYGSVSSPPSFLFSFLSLFPLALPPPSLCTHILPEGER